MITLLQPKLPAASKARMVTELFPTSSGMVADQTVVPAAAPAVPKLVAQETRVTPRLSLVVPAMVIDVALVDSVAVEGEVMVKDGAVVSAPPPIGGGVITACRVTVRVLEIWLPAAEAVTVMMLGPTINGTFEMVHADAEPVAMPENPRSLDHVSVIAPDPPVADPNTLVIDVVVGEATGLTTSVKGEIEGGETLAA